VDWLGHHRRQLGGNRPKNPQPPPRLETLSKLNFPTRTTYVGVLATIYMMQVSP